MAYNIKGVPIGDAARFTGRWSDGSSAMVNDMVVDPPWTMIANKAASDTPAPQPFSPMAWSFASLPAWATETAINTVYTGARLTIAENFRLIDAGRVWLPDVAADTEYWFAIEDITDPSNPVVLTAGEVEKPASIGWQEIRMPRLLILSGTTLDFVLQSNKREAGGPSTWTYQWNYTNAATPSSGQWAVAGLDVRIHKSDQGATDRTSDLAQVKPGDQLYMAEAGDASRFQEWLVGDVTDAGAYYEFECLLVASGGNIRNNQPCNVTATIEPLPVATSYVKIDNYWSSVDPANGTVNGFESDHYPPDTLNQNGYGVDLYGQSLVRSPDWDVVAYSGGAYLIGV